MLKHNENLENKEKVKYDLYKILRMSILLNQNESDQITLDKFKEASLNIDKMLSKEYDDKLETMFYSTTTLEEEEERLKNLVAFITERIEKRKDLLEDYRNVTSKELNDLEYIDKSSELDLYEKRLDTIKNYLDSSKLIEVNEHDLELLKSQLVKEYDIKSANEVKNIKIEEELFTVFVNALYEMDLYSSLDLSNVDKAIMNLEKEIQEAKDQKDTFITAFNNLKSSGISGDLELEYASYVENSKRNYYYVKEKEIILKLYKLIESKESEYSNLFNKREEVKELLQERILLRSNLNIKEKDYLIPVSDLILEQKQEIEHEKENVDNINVLTERIKLKENRLDTLKKELNKPEVLSILKEYSLIDTYDHEEILEEDSNYEVSLEEEQSENDKDPAYDILKDLLSNEDNEETKEENLVVEEENTKEEKVILPNQIKEIRNVPSMNFGLSRLKSISVMKRVGDMLGVNAKKEEIEEKKVVVSEVPEVKSEPKEELPKEEDLFWTPAEFADMKTETENTQNVSNDDIAIPNLEVKMPEVKEDNQIFETNSVDSGLIFPEPVMPEFKEKVLPENKDDKFMWPENMETFDLNGIFPN